MCDHEDLKIEYQEANAQLRQIDNRIWIIHGLYLSALVGAWALLLKDQTLPRVRIVFPLAACMVTISIIKMILVNHLIWFNDIITERVYKLEETLGYGTYLLVKEKRKCFHSAYKGQTEWRYRPGRSGWKILTARNVMTIFTWGNISLWAAAPILKMYPVYGVDSYNNGLHFIAEYPLLSGLIGGVFPLLTIVGIFSLLARYRWYEEGVGSFLWLKPKKLS